MVIGTALIMAALSLFLWNAWADRRAGERSQEALQQLFEYTEEEGGRADPYDPSVPEKVIDGWSYMGCLDIPSLGLKLPVMSDLSYPGLKIAPCRYTGSPVTDNLVIAAHNYSRHFGKLGDLVMGDAVYFTDLRGTVYAYEAEEIDLLHPEDVEEMTDSGYALTLFTCTYGGQSRVTVRCRRAEKF